MRCRCSAEYSALLASRRSLRLLRIHNLGVVTESSLHVKVGCVLVHADLSEVSARYCLHTLRRLGVHDCVGL